MKPRDYLSFYATKFNTVEIDSNYYGTPSVATVNSWYQKTPPDFTFAAKVPQVVTHQKVLVDCDNEFTEFVERMNGLKEKLGPLLMQFPHFNKYEFKTGADFLEQRHCRDAITAEAYMVSSAREPECRRVGLAKRSPDFHGARREAVRLDVRRHPGTRMARRLRRPLRAYNVGAAAREVSQHKVEQEMRRVCDGLRPNNMKPLNLDFFLIVVLGAP